MKKSYQNMGTGMAVFVSIVAIASLVGWIMNLQNLWEYWPETGKFADVGMPWIVSTIGIVIPVIGVVTGWIF